MIDEYDILNYVYKNAKMGSDSTNTLLKSLENKDNKITEVVNDILNSYNTFLKQSESLLKSMNEKGKGFSHFTNISADMGIKMQVLKDNSDSAIADMLINGLTMGEIEMTKMFSCFDENVDRDIKKLIRDFKDFQTNAIDKLKKIFIMTPYLVFFLYNRNFILIKKYNKCIIFIDKHMYAIYNINYNLKKGR